MAGNQGRGKRFFRHLLSGNSSKPTLLKETLMRGGLRVPLGRNRRPDTVRPNVRVRCTKCVLALMTRLASRVVGGFQ